MYINMCNIIVLHGVAGNAEACPNASSAEVYSDLEGLGAEEAMPNSWNLVQWQVQGLLCEDMWRQR